MHYHCYSYIQIIKYLQLSLELSVCSSVINTTKHKHVELQLIHMFKYKVVINTVNAVILCTL